MSVVGMVNAAMRRVTAKYEPVANGRYVGTFDPRMQVSLMIKTPKPREVQLRGARTGRPVQANTICTPMLTDDWLLQVRLIPGDEPVEVWIVS